MSRALVGVFALVALLPAQEFRSTISGLVADGQGAAVAGAKLEAKQTQTGAVFQTVSGDDGQYTLPFLPPGDYVITASAQGFKQFVREGIRVSTNQRIPLDIALEVGQVTETVTISAETPLLQTATASSGQVIDTATIEKMPMNGRTPLVLAQLAFGVIPSSDPRFYRPFDNGGPSGFSMGGGWPKPMNCCSMARRTRHATAASPTIRRWTRSRK